MSERAAWLAVGVALCASACAGPGDGPGDRPRDASAEPWGRELFDGASLGGWEVADFASGEVLVEDGRLLLEFGHPLTGVVWAGEPPARDGYAIEVEAERLAGSDFFLGLTLPIGAEHATVILGGWGGSLCGLSSVDGADASKNPTKRFRAFPAGRPVTVRVEVSARRVATWVDGELLFEQPRAEHCFSVRGEMRPCLPLGIATYQTRSAIRRITIGAL